MLETEKMLAETPTVPSAARVAAIVGVGVLGDCCRRRPARRTKLTFAVQMEMEKAFSQ